MTQMPDPTRSRGDLFARLIAANYRRIYAYVLALTADPTNADDAMQETSAVLWAKFDRFEPGTDFAAWAMAAARLVVLEQRRTSRRRPALPLSDELLGTIADAATRLSDRYDARREALTGCLDRLADADRRLIRWRYEQQAGVADIAGRVGVTTQAIYKSLTRVHDALLRCVRRTLAEDEGR